jgi:hypothetical protein
VPNQPRYYNIIVAIKMAINCIGIWLVFYFILFYFKHVVVKDWQLCPIFPFDFTLGYATCNYANIQDWHILACVWRNEYIFFKYQKIAKNSTTYANNHTQNTLHLPLKITIIKIIRFNISKKYNNSTSSCFPLLNIHPQIDPNTMPSAWHSFIDY